MSAGPNELKITRTSAAGGGVETVTGLTTITSSVYTTAHSDILSISIGTGITAIANNTFSNRTNLTGLEIVSGSGSQLTIGEGAFEGSGLSGTITIPASVQTIDQQAFQNIGSLTGVVFESGSQLQSIGSNIFQGSGLSSFTAPQSVLTVFSVSEGSGQTVSGKSGVTVTILVDNTIPVITSGATGTTLITETGVGQTVYTINATDNIAVTSYAIGGADSAALSVNSSTGVVTLTGNPVEATKNRYNFTVTASDAAGNTSTPQSVSFIVSPACFPAGTPVLTDQGEIAIEKIDPKKHTIRGNNIEEVTKSIGIEDFLVCIKKDTLYPNVPSQDTYVTCDHKIFFKDTLYRAGFLEARAHKSGNHDLMNNICQVPYNGEVLYNVLLKDNKHDYMCVNKMIVETMDPKNVFAKYYCYLKNKKQGEKNNKIEKEYEQYISNCYAMVKKHKRSRLTQK